MVHSFACKMFQGKENVLDDNPKWNSFGHKTTEQLLLTIGIRLMYWTLKFMIKHWTWFMLTRVWWLFLIIIWNETRQENQWKASGNSSCFNLNSIRMRIKMFSNFRMHRCIWIIYYWTLFFMTFQFVRNILSI